MASTKATSVLAWHPRYSAAETLQLLADASRDTGQRGIKVARGCGLPPSRIASAYLFRPDDPRQPEEPCARRDYP